MSISTFSRSMSGSGRNEQPWPTNLHLLLVCSNSDMRSLWDVSPSKKEVLRRFVPGCGEMCRMDSSSCWSPKKVSSNRRRIWIPFGPRVRIVLGGEDGDGVRSSGEEDEGKNIDWRRSRFAKYFVIGVSLPVSILRLVQAPGTSVTRQGTRLYPRSPVEKWTSTVDSQQ